MLPLQEKNGVKTSDMYHIDTTGTSICQKLLEDIEKCNYFTLLMDGSPDSSFAEQAYLCFVFR